MTRRGIALDRGRAPSSRAAGSWIPTFACVDRVGIVAAIAGGLSRHDGFIRDSQQYADVA